MHRLPAAPWALLLGTLFGCASGDDLDNVRIQLELHDEDGSCERVGVTSVTHVLARVAYGNVQDALCQRVSPPSDVAGLAAELAKSRLRFKDIPPGPVTIEIQGHRFPTCPRDKLLLCGRVEQELSGLLQQITVPVWCSLDPMAPELARCLP